MGEGGGLGTRQVGNGAGDLQRTVGTTGRPAQLGRSRLQKFGRRGVQLGVGIDGLAAQGLVGHALAGHGAGAGGRATAADALGRLASRAAEQLVGRQGWHFDVQVNPVHQRAAELGLVAVHLVGRAAAAVRG